VNRVGTLKLRSRSNGIANKLEDQDRPAHDWFRFVLSFPPHLVREYLTQFDLTKKQKVLDPFCGTGTTVVECKKNGYPSVGLEANPFAHFAGCVKINWDVKPEGLLRHATQIAETVLERLEEDGVPDLPLTETDRSMLLFEPHVRKQQSISLRELPIEEAKLLLANSISPKPLHKTLLLLDQIRSSQRSQYSSFETLALAKTLVYSASNLHFGPEVGVTTPKSDAAVVTPWINQIKEMVADLKLLKDRASTPTEIVSADSRFAHQVLNPKSIDAVITSPPYPNEKDYTRTTRLESVILGFVKSMGDLRALKKGLVRSNTRSVYKDDIDDQLVSQNKKVQAIAAAIEARRIELGKTSGFEKMYHRVAKLYFGGMARHFENLRTVLKPGARLAYVVGDQASYLRVMIRTGEILAEIAETVGYKCERIDLFRTRLATATKEQLREEVLVLRWDGYPPSRRFDHISAEG